MGQVDFINCLPINLPIELGEINLNANIISAVPAQLNKMILNNEINIAPISSIVYLENKDKLELFADLCIASNGPADSVLLFSELPIEALHGETVSLSKTSATSNKLLQVIFKEFLKIEVNIVSNNPKAKLLIGDDALLEYSKDLKAPYIYDLGTLWKKYTGLPMVFGLWVIRKNYVEGIHEFPLLANNLKEAKNLGLTKLLDQVIKKAQEKISLPAEFYLDYFKHLSYDLNDECKKGLDLFEKIK